VVRAGGRVGDDRVRRRERSPAHGRVNSATITHSAYCRPLPSSGMRFLLNIIWVVLCGFWMAIGYVLAGIVCCILIITIPFGIASFRIAGFALWPFGRTVVSKPMSGAPSFIGNVIWFIFAGLWLAIAHFVTGIALFITIIGIPLALANFKLIPVSLAPLGKDIVRLDDPSALRTVS
jgi:uncharacterized membrane protein YccF (DUF307 family)